MTLALAVRAAPPFNVAFYSVVATVIPVLFLAIAVQGRLYEDLVRVAVTTYYAPRGKSMLRQLPAALLGAVLTIAVAVVLVAGVAGEIQAILSLDWRRATGGGNAVAAEGIILLTLVAATGPVLVIEKHVRPYFRADWERLRGLADRRRPGEAERAAAEAPPELPPQDDPADGKPDAS